MMVDFTLLLLTWNVMDTSPSRDYVDHLSNFVASSISNGQGPDFIAIGFQEVKFPTFSEEPWTSATKHALKIHDFVAIKKIKLVGILLIVLAKRDLLPKIRNLSTSYVKTGLGGYWGNKGAVGIRFDIDDRSVVVINSHLSAHDYNFPKRVKEYFVITQNMLFEMKKPIRYLTIGDHDVIIWIGDLNFRLENIETHEISINIDSYYSKSNSQNRSSKSLEHLLQYDQLPRAQSAFRAFESFSEPNITFAPTYKFKPFTDDYDLSRKPSWCDRILVKTGEKNFDIKIQADKYQAHFSLKQSDHKPVSQILKLSIPSKSKRNRRAVRFAKPTNWKTSRESAAFFTLEPNDYNLQDLSSTRHLVSDNFSTRNSPNLQGLILRGTSDNISVFDWVGLYPADFDDLDEPLTYVWIDPDPLSELQSRSLSLLPSFSNLNDTASSSSSTETTNVKSNKSSPWYRVDFSDLVLLRPGKCRLVYFNEIGDVLSISDPFEINS